MRCRYACVNCGWPESHAGDQGCLTTALSHFCATGHRIEMVAADPADR